MTASTVIHVEGLGKCYHHPSSDRYGTLRDRLAEIAMLRWRKKKSEPFWALRDVSFSVASGEVLGVIGGNGAGKSTLLKLLSRITEPSAGRARINGRIGSLLEVGSGFHPELTGRENIFLNGSIIGMQRSEIAKHFDEIVEFSDVKEFIEIPVKRYSSGMYTRLAFAVAAHLSTEILLLDEVLAVGDAGFQKKCLGRIGQVAGDGRTIIFVSHNLQAVRSTCQRVLWLDHGQVRACGATELVLADYLRSYSAGVDEVGIAAQIAALPEDQAICLLAVVVEQDGVLNGEPVTGKPINIRIDYRVLRETHGLRVYVVLHDIEGTPLFRSFAFGEDDVLPTLGPGHYRSCTSIPADLLAPIPYRLQISAAVHNQRHCFPFGVSVPLHVREAGRLRHAYSSSGMIGVKLAPVLSWNTERVSERTER